MRGLRAFNFKKGIIGNSTLSLDSLILHVMDTGISITEGVVEIYDVVINGGVGLAVVAECSVVSKDDPSNSTKQ